MTEKQNLSHK